MKIYLATLLLSVIAFTSCKEPESLPKKYEINSEYAIPIFSQSIKLSQFEYFTLPGNLNNPVTVDVFSGELSYDFPFKDFYDEGNVVEWIEPKVFINDSLPAGTEIKLELYAKETNGAKNYFWLPKNSLYKTPGPFIIPEDPVRLTQDVINRIKNSDKIYLNINIKFNGTPIGNTLLNYKIKVDLGFKAKINATFNT